MTPPLPFPGSQTVAAWWRELAPHRPSRLWLCHLLLHRVEALAEVFRPCPLNGLRRELLRSVSVGRRPQGLEAGFLASLTRELIGAGFLARAGPETLLTDTGRQAIATGPGAVGSPRRQTFYFLDNRAVQLPPHLLRVYRPGTSVTPSDPWNFDPELLQDAARQDATWRDRFGYPADVTALRLPGPSDGDWRSIVFDRAEHLFVAFIETPASGGGSQLLGFAARSEGWTLELRSPAVEVREGWQEVLPDLAADPSEEDWRRSWQAAGEQFALSREEAESCRLARSGLILRVEAPPKVLSRIPASRTDATNGESWLLAGEGRARAAVRVEVVQRVG